MYYCNQVRKLSCCCFNICRLKSLHDCVVGMCSAGSSNVNILHPPSHSPVPGPGIPHPSNSRLVPALFLFLSLSVAHKHTETHSFLSLCDYFRPTISFLPYLPHTFLHFLFAAVPSIGLPSFPFPSFHLFFPPTNPPSPSLSLLSCSLIWVYLHGGA